MLPALRHPQGTTPCRSDCVSSSCNLHLSRPSMKGHEDIGAVLARLIFHEFQGGKKMTSSISKLTIRGRGCCECSAVSWLPGSTLQPGVAPHLAVSRDDTGRVSGTGRGNDCRPEMFRQEKIRNRSAHTVRFHILHANIA